MGSYLASIYQYIYDIIIAIITFVYVARFKYSVVKRPNGRGDELSLLLLMILFIGLRPISGYFVDMSSYNYQLQRFRGETFYFMWDTDNKIFDNLIRWWSCNEFEPKLFFLLIAIIYFGCAYIGIRRLFSNHTLLAYAVFLGAFSTFSYSTNGIKAGAAASVFIMALSYWDNLRICLPLMFVSLGFHHSMVMPIGAFLLTVFFRTPKWYYYGWFFCFLLACFHVTYFQIFFGGMADEQGAGYLLATEETTVSHISFRPDFVLYSAMPVILGYNIEMKQRLHLSQVYTTLMHFYLATNSIWMLCMYASFTNRIAYLSWFIYPIVIIYPFLDAHNRDPRRFVKLRRIVLYHLYFTLFMDIVYYGLLSLGN